MRENTEVCCALHIIMAAENIGPATGSTHIAQSQLQRTICTGVVIPVCVLCAAHTPDKGARTIIGHGLGHTLQL